MDHHSEKKDSNTALIIDDEVDICFLLSNILRSNKLDVKFVNSISEGKSYFKSTKPALLFLDNHLQDGYGVDFIRYVKKEYADTKIIMVTAHDTPEDRKKAMKEGADFFIAKPFSAAEIRHAIQHFQTAE